MGHQESFQSLNVKFLFTSTSVEDKTQGFMHIGHVFYQQHHTPRPNTIVRQKTLFTLALHNSVTLTYMKRCQ